MSKCGICGKARRVGSGGRALLLDSAGQLRTATACAACLERSIRLVALPPPTMTTIESDDSDVKKVLRGLAKHLRNMGKGRPFDAGGANHPCFRDGLEQAADFAEAWADERAARKPDATNDAPIVMRGWVCKTCKSWNGDEKERRETCRVCAGPRAVESNVSHVVSPNEPLMCETRAWDHASNPPRFKRCLLRENHEGENHRFESTWNEQR